ncbi:MAG TPA: class I SAM-dependent methyltransferase, partial [Pirellulales bacterium]
EPLGVKNIKLVHGSLIDPFLPTESMDLVLLVDVYHEFSHPEHMLAAIRKSLKPDGRVVLVEFRGEDLQVPIQPLHKMTKKQVLRELEPNGFKLVEEYNELPWQHMLFFGRDPDFHEPTAEETTSEAKSDNANPARSEESKREQP